MAKKLILPELLAPAGSPIALRAAIEGGADAVYMGGVSFNARINAKNFTTDELKDGISLAHSYGTKVYIAANTLIYDREREDFLRAAEQAYLCGADALIVADLGMAKEIKKRIPIELHASTQISGHNVEAAKRLAGAGFSRMVCAREMSREDIRQFCDESPIEAEVFVHGALCVSCSGQCLFSSIVGGRSGNRGECAQPCRLPYSLGRGKTGYPLSLRDLSLAEYICELRDMGVASLKIEGRMKSPKYVRDVTRVWRTLLDEGRNATAKDISDLAKIFSRGGFTDGYYTKRIDSTMLGVRSDEDKKQSADLVPFDRITRKLPLAFSAKIALGEPSKLTARTESGLEVTVYGQCPEHAQTAPLTRETVERNLSKLGATPYILTSFELELDDGAMMPISALNALRRAAIDALAPSSVRSEADICKAEFEKPEKTRTAAKSAVFYNTRAIPDSAPEFFNIIFVPLEDYEKCPKRANGIMLPEVIFDSQSKKVRELLKKAKDNGAEHALVGNLGHAELVKEFGFSLHGDMRLNVCNTSTAAELERLGFEDVILSPELTLAQMRDIKGESATVVYGRLPLMITEKCVGKELGSCEKCKSGTQTLTDRKGISFPVLRRFEHRSAIFNSVPTYMADRAQELSRYGITRQHFIFTVESKKEVEDLIKAHKKGSAPLGAVRRIK